ncbi:MAG: isopentenyl phosphate kinase [Thermosphaera sp.]
MEKDIVFLKAGGSLITFKDRPVSVNYEALKTLAEALKKVHENVTIVMGNGGGSFAHYTVSKYASESMLKLLVKCQQSTRLLNRLIVDYLVFHDIPATGLQTSAVIGYGKETIKVFTPPIVNLLKNNIIPVLYGECILSDSGSIEIFSTEKVFEVLSSVLKPSRIVLLADVAGVYSCDPKKCSNPKLIRHINDSNLNEILNSLEEELGRDATGGMFSKVKSMSELSRKTGVKVILTSGFNAEYIVDAVTGKVPKEATVIEVGVRY